MDRFLRLTALARESLEWRPTRSLRKERRALECQSLRENSDMIRELDVACCAASVDEPETNRRFAVSLEANYPILSDPDEAVAEACTAGRDIATRLGELGVARRTK